MIFSRFNNSQSVRTGTTMIEVLVSFTLLATIISISVPGFVRHSRMVQQMRHERLAMDELDNQLERLCQTPFHQLAQESKLVQPSNEIQKELPGVQVTGAFQESDEGAKVSIEIVWDEPGRRENPLRLSTWVYPASNRTLAPTKEQP